MKLLLFLLTPIYKNAGKTNISDCILTVVRMVRKFIYDLSGPPPEYNGPDELEPNQNQSVMLNEHIHSFLRYHKDNIGEHYKNKKWDKYKKFANDYELIYTSSTMFPSISKYPAISRSYFKLWEMLSDFEPQFKYKTKTNLRAVFLAEGPGGFLEAFARYRDHAVATDDTLYGITLLSMDRSIPHWKIPKDIMSSRKVRLLKGVDNTGSLYNTENIEDFVREIGENNADIVTSDGGFDFSTDFNSQEELSIYLIIAEMYTAFRLQKKGGTFFLKIYDIHNMATMRILYLLAQSYNHMYIVKPLSSRPANSEKYVVCHDFKGLVDPVAMHTLRRVIETEDCKLIDQELVIPVKFLNRLVNYNVYYISKQVLQIHKTLLFISNMKHDKSDPQFHSNLKHQILKSIKWCNKYEMKISIESLQHYKKTYCIL